MSSTMRRGVRAAAVATAVCATFGLVTGSALASNDDPDLKAEISEPAPVVPGGSGDVRYVVTNVSEKATEGILMNVSLPRYVSLDLGERCQQTGTTEDGGTLISCNLNGDLGKLAPGESRESITPFHVSPDAPAGTALGRLGALVVPLANGEPTEDWKDLDGPNVVWASITTAAVEPYECAAEHICIYENADGTGPSSQIDFGWAGGYKLDPSGWANRASSIRNNQGSTRWLYTLDESRNCAYLRDTIQPGEKRAVAPGADKNFDLIANEPYTECR